MKKNNGIVEVGDYYIDGKRENGKTVVEFMLLMNSDCQKPILYPRKNKENLVIMRESEYKHLNSSKASEDLKTKFSKLFEEEYTTIPTKRPTKSKKEQAFEFLTKSKNFEVMVGTDEGKDLNYACLMLFVKEIDKIFVLANAYKQHDLETYTQLLNIKEALEND